MPELIIWPFWISPLRALELFQSIEQQLDQPPSHSLQTHHFPLAAMQTCLALAGDNAGEGGTHLCRESHLIVQLHRHLRFALIVMGAAVSEPASREMPSLSPSFLSPARRCVRPLRTCGRCDAFLAV